MCCCGPTQESGKFSPGWLCQAPEAKISVTEVLTDPDVMGKRPCQTLGATNYGVCEVFFWRYAIPLFTVTYEPYQKGD
jgi:hypothetical protein